MSQRYAGWALTAGILPVAAGAVAAEFRVSPWWNERTLARETPDGVRLLVNAPAAMDPKRPTLLVVYATPNGNTLEQTLGCERADGVDWHFDIQHIAAQTRFWRARDRSRNIVLAVVQAEEKSWPAWRGKAPERNPRIREFVTALRGEVAPGARVALTGHSGGGSFLSGFIEGGQEIPDWVERIAYLDANYSWSNDLHRGKVLGWLNGDKDRRLVALAYDDRNITVDGKPVVSPTGGTYRATLRMVEGFAPAMSFTTRRTGDLDTWTAEDGRVRFLVDRNPGNRILHTVLVETNGFLFAMTAGTLREKDAPYRGARAYSKYIQPWEPAAPVGTRAMPFPPRRSDAPGGKAEMEAAAQKPLVEREADWERGILSGNLPDALRTFQVIETRSVDARGRPHTARIAVSPDVLSIGGGDDAARVPLTPGTAARVLDALGCALPTRRLSDAIHRAADAKLEPKPLTEDRESVETFLRHDAIVDEQAKAHPDARLLAGHKKDVVRTERLAGDVRHVAIYGWHYLDGKPIQPLYTGHVAWYVDYSHGIRLVAREMVVDGKPMDYEEVLRDRDLRGLVSDEPPPPRGGDAP